MKLFSRSRRLGSGSPDAATTKGGYVSAAPSPETLAGLFTGQWVSQFPAPFEHLSGGSIPLFDDERIHWASSRLGGLRGQSVLEIGPLEGGHTYMLAGLGGSITAVEANVTAFLKCLVINELFQLRHARFLCGDALEYLKQERQTFDLAVTVNAFYHLREPIEFLWHLSRVSARLFLWTHYYDRKIVPAMPGLAWNFTREEEVEGRGLSYHRYRREHRKSEFDDQVYGGRGDYSHWLDRDTILEALEEFGYTKLEVGLEEPEHPVGPAFAILAERG